MKASYLLFCGIFFFAGEALANDRVKVSSGLETKDVRNGRKVTFPANRGFSFEVIDSAGEEVKVRFFDRQGLAVTGEYFVPKEAVKDVLKNDIAAGLKAASGGNEKKVPGCCEVDESATAEEPKVANRKPAIEPGTSIVYAAPIPRRQVAPSLPPALAQAPKPRAPASEPLCRALDAFRAKGVPDAPLRQALYFYSRAKANGTVAKDSRYLSIADYSQRSDQKRFYLLDLKTMSVTKEKVSHGGGTYRRGYAGDPNHDGMLNKCSQADGMTRPGFYRVGDYYFSQKGRYRWPLLSRTPPRNGLRMTGLTPGVNHEALGDGVVMHEAKYNSASGFMGRSFGCPAFVPGRGKPLMDKLRGGGLFYGYAPMCRNETVKTLAQVRGWQQFCR